MSIFKQGKTSKYIGVGKSYNNLWRSKISINYKTISIGMYDSEIEAAKAYNEYVIKNKLPNKLNVFDEDIELNNDFDILSIIQKSIDSQISNIKKVVIEKDAEISQLRNEIRELKIRLENAIAREKSTISKVQDMVQQRVNAFFKK